MIQLVFLLLDFSVNIVSLIEYNNLAFQEIADAAFIRNGLLLGLSCPKSHILEAWTESFPDSVVLQMTEVVFQSPSTIWLLLFKFEDFLRYCFHCVLLSILYIFVTKAHIVFRGAFWHDTALLFLLDWTKLLISGQNIWKSYVTFRKILW